MTAKARSTTTRARPPRPSIEGSRPLKLLGAIIAGGQARRFGSDKAYARLHGQRLIDLVGRALAVQCQGLVVCGREESGFDCLADRPGPGLGPLGGLAAALHHGAAQGYDAVLSSGCDIPNLPVTLAAQLAAPEQEIGPAIVQEQPVVGLWPVSLADRLDAFLAGGGRALYGFAESVGARQITAEPVLMNINTPDDLPRD